LSASLLEAAASLRRLDVPAARRGQGFAPEALNPVTDLLRQLIARLQEEASAETSHKEWCDNEKQTSTQAKTARETAIGNLQQEIPRLQTSIEMTDRERQFAQETLQRIADENVAASAVRSTSNEEFTRAHADHVEVIRALDSALSAMTGMSFSLLETGAASGARQSPFSAHSEAGAATNAVGMLQDLRNQYVAAKADLEAEEKQQESSFLALKHANEVFRRATQQTLNTKEQEGRQLTQRLGEAEKELDGARTELGEVTKYLTDLQPACDDIRSSFEERKRRREEEVQALQAALNALDSSMALA